MDLASLQQAAGPLGAQAAREVPLRRYVTTKNATTHMRRELTPPSLVAHDDPQLVDKLIEFASWVIAGVRGRISTRQVHVTYDPAVIDSYEWHL